MAPIAEQKDAINVGPTISVGDADSYFILMAITIVGISVILEVFIARKVIMERLATSSPPFNRFNSSIAFIPRGVAAFPSPNIFAIILESM